MQRPSAVCFWRVHKSERLRRLPVQDAVGEHARRVPYTTRWRSCSNVRDKLSNMRGLCRIAPLHKRHHIGRVQSHPLGCRVAREHPTARSEGKRSRSTALRKLACRE